MAKLIFYMCLFIVHVQGQFERYNGYKLYNVVPKNGDDLQLLESIKRSGVGEFWEEHFHVGHDVKVAVAPFKQNAFVEDISKNKMDVRVIFENLQDVMNNQNPTNRSARSDSGFFSLSWDRYYTLQEIHYWLDELAEAYPDIVTPLLVGNSVENREMKGIKIDFHPERTDKKIGFIEGGIHAREWISPATVTWIIKEFLTSDDPDVRSLADNIEWHFFPVINPDGYYYTFTTHRMWRKNRSTASSKECEEGIDDDMSNGVDLNRNFDFEWMSAGASNDSCSNLYAGPTAASEPETRAISQHILDLRANGDILFYISFHSYTQLFIVPYSNLNNVQRLGANNYADMYEVAIKSASKLTELYGTTYRTGLAVDVLYPMSGSSFDFAKQSGGADMSFLIELRDLGEFGFLLPASQIIPNNLEVMEAIKEMSRTTRSLRYYDNASTSIMYSVYVIAIEVVLLLLFY